MLITFVMVAVWLILAMLASIVSIDSEGWEESEEEADASDERKSAEKKESTPAWALEKEKGNAAFGRGDFHAARERYDAALALVPASDASASATLLANRAIQVVWSSAVPSPSSSSSSPSSSR